MLVQLSLQNREYERMGNLSLELPSLGAPYGPYISADEERDAKLPPGGGLLQHCCLLVTACCEKMLACVCSWGEEPGNLQNLLLAHSLPLPAHVCHGRLVRMPRGCQHDRCNLML